ncbi:General transcription factor IIF subunit 2 [Collichthys lucidus]|uniref:General transcription factor IIF subunit 2 n=1 Tax=Collichthys lucidus TaxID=240159 RepID=A0A4U5U232_COLLU|nr:General transcription factor IIF subunit 2 [Collichthys lucidus]
MRREGFILVMVDEGLVGGGLFVVFNIRKTYLKEIMKEIGTYNNKGAHKKSTWELKPEYRHYQSAEEEEEMQTA